MRGVLFLERREFVSATGLQVRGAIIGTREIQVIRRRESPPSSRPRTQLRIGCCRRRIPGRPSRCDRLHAPPSRCNPVLPLCSVHVFASLRPRGASNREVPCLSQYGRKGASGGFSQERLELFHRQARLAQDATEHEWRQSLSRMHWHRYPLPLGTDQKVVVPLT